MSLKPTAIPSIPKMTVQVAQAAFRKGNVYMQMRDVLGTSRALDAIIQAEREHLLPVDQHLLIAAVAPRPVYIASATDDFWADPHGEFLGARHANPAYELLGFDGLTTGDWPPPAEASTGRIGYHLRPGGHDLLEADWVQFLDFISTQWNPPA